MDIIDYKEVTIWGSRQDAKGAFPYLIDMLVAASTVPKTYYNFPYGSAVYEDEWDGIVNCPLGTKYVPQGNSYWELGTEKPVKSKAERDYLKRKHDPLGAIPSKSTYIFVTTQKWKPKQKAKWVKEKLDEGFWNDVIVYDAEDLIHWIRDNHRVFRYFAEEIKRLPFDTVVSAENYWKELSESPRGTLLPEVITVGREFQQQELERFLEGQNGMIAIRSSTKNESIAFILATALQFQESKKKRFFARGLVIESHVDYRIVIRNNPTPLALIPAFDNQLPIFQGVAQGHHVLIPIGAADDFDHKTITLPTIDKRKQVDGLVKMGIEKSVAERYTEEANGNITILKRILKFQDRLTKPKWVGRDDLMEIIPTLLIGRWNEKHQGDIEVIEQLSNKAYSDFKALLKEWSSLEDTPFVKIGDSWRVISPLDTWIHISNFLTFSDLENLKSVYLKVFKDGNPYVKEEEDLPEYIHRERVYSEWIRKGLCHSLILVAVHGKKIANKSDLQYWVDDINQELFKNKSGEHWVSLERELPLIAEASPDVFLKAVFSSLDSEDVPIKKMFEEKEGFMNTISHHAGLLWALEGIAWLPDYFYQSTLALIRLAVIDPGGSWANRPINSLLEIFKVWHFQTLVNKEEREATLSKIVNQEKQKGWELLLGLLPNPLGGVAHPTHQLKWRIFEESITPNTTYQEIWDSNTFIVSLLLEIFDGSEQQLAELIKASENVSDSDRVLIVEFVRKIARDIEITNDKPRQALMHILAHNRSHPDNDWSKPEEILRDYESLIELVSPDDIIQNNKWLFDSHQPEFPEGFDYGENITRRDEERKKLTQERRKEALLKIFKEHNLQKVITLSREVEVPSSLGETLSEILESQNDRLGVLRLINKSELIENTDFIYGFVFNLNVRLGIKGTIEYYHLLKKEGISEESLSHLFIPLNSKEEIWDFVKTNPTLERSYWTKHRPWLYKLNKEAKIECIKYLVKYKRHITAVNIIGRYNEDVPPKLVSDVLWKAGTEKSIENDSRWNKYIIERLFKVLYDGKVSEETLINLEFLYIDALKPIGKGKEPITLQKKLSEDPKFFVEVLKWGYKSKDGGIRKREEKEDGLTEKMRANRGKKVFDLLQSWTKVPRVNEKNEINEEELSEWIDKARENAKEIGRLKIADSYIGEILAQYPESEIKLWPPHEICNQIERIDTEEIKQQFSISTTNKRSFSSRGAFDGGDIERANAAYFTKMSEGHRKDFPIVAKILKDIAKRYELDAKRMDDEAKRSWMEN